MVTGVLHLYFFRTNEEDFEIKHYESQVKDYITEGKAEIQIGNSFYRSQSAISRDLGVLAAEVYRQRQARLRVLDVMSGCGIRALRYALESQADWVWANDGNPDVSEVLQHNLAQLALPSPTGTLPSTRYQITHQEANRLLLGCYYRQDFYDLVDLDCFGSPAPYLSASLGAVAIGGLLYLTSTDGRTATGHAPQNCLSDYGAYVRVHPAGHEQGLRLLIGRVQQLAATNGFGVEPIFSFFKGQIYRVMVRLVARSCLTPQNYGYLGYCHHCGNYRAIAWRELGRAVCPHDAQPMVVTGPIWLGQLHDAEYLQACIALAEAWNWKSQARLLRLMQTETDLPPYFYLLGEIGRRGQIDIPKRASLTQILQDWGYRVSSTHIHPDAIKTDANLQTCVRAAKSISA